MRQLLWRIIFALGAVVISIPQLVIYPFRMLLLPHGKLKNTLDDWAWLLDVYLYEWCDYCRHKGEF